MEQTTCPPPPVPFCIPLCTYSTPSDPFLTFLLLRVRSYPQVPASRIAIMTQDGSSNASTIVCVTGGTGFIGAHIVQMLLQAGYTGESGNHGARPCVACS